MIKTIFWDFDGVILNSMKIKGDGFLELFKDYDKKYLDLIEKYHYENGGVSRFNKIRYFYEHILKKTVEGSIISQLADEFAMIIENKLYDKDNLINETVEFIKQNYTKYKFHIVSGAEDKELNQLCKFFEIEQYFLSIDGSPIQKEDLIRNILRKYNYDSREVILIGDSINDYNASKKNDILFYGFNNINLKKNNYIENFKGVRF